MKDHLDVTPTSSSALPLGVCMSIWTELLIGRRGVRSVLSRAVSHCDCCYIYKMFKKRNLRVLLLKTLYLQQSQQWWSSYILLLHHPCWKVTDSLPLAVSVSTPLVRSKISSSLCFLYLRETSSPWRKVSLFLSRQTGGKKKLNSKNTVGVTVASRFSSLCCL